MLDLITKILGSLTVLSTFVPLMGGIFKKLQTSAMHGFFKELAIKTFEGYFFALSLC